MNATGPTRRVQARKAATIVALAPTAVIMVSGCTHLAHRHRDQPRPPGTRPVTLPSAPSTSRVSVTTAPPVTRPPVVTTQTTASPPTTAPPVVTTAPPTTAAAPRTVTGPAVRHQYGPVQVTVTISGGRITNATATAPNDNPMSAGINGDAVPKLNAEVLAAQSANIAAVSGATLTSPAYKQSLQGALDQAGFPG